jgi:Tfp pilus assembly protein PilO
MLKKLRSRNLMEMLEEIKVKPAHMLAALGGVLVVAYVVVGVSYFQLRGEQPGLKQQIEAGGGTLSGIGDSGQTLKDLQDQLAYLDSGLATLQQALPAKLDSAVIVQGLVDYANQAHVSIAQMNALPATQVKGGEDGDAGYVILPYSLVVAGGQSEMLTFLSLLEKGMTQTAALGDVEMTNGVGGDKMTLKVSFYAKPESATTGTPSPTPKATSAAKAKSS